MSQFDMRELIARNKQLSLANLTLMEQNERYKETLKEWGKLMIQTVKDGDLKRLETLKYPEDLTQ